jgi:hypothetical protein
LIVKIYRSDKGDASWVLGVAGGNMVIKSILMLSSGRKAK